MKTATYADIVNWDDVTLVEWRRQALEELSRNPDSALQRLYDASTKEVGNRGMARWVRAPAGGRRER